MARLCNVPIKSLKDLSPRQLVEYVIFPYGVYKKGTHYEVTDDFLSFMTDWGRECWFADRFSGTMLFETALLYILRKGEKKEFVRTDKASFAFLERHLSFLVRTEKVSELATEVVFGLLDNVDEITGEPLNDFVWDDSANLRCVRWEIDELAWRVAKGDMDEQVVFEHFAQPHLWHKHLAYFHEKWPTLSKEQRAMFFKRINVTSFWKKFQIGRKIKNYTYDGRSLYEI